MKTVICFIAAAIAAASLAVAPARAGDPAFAVWLDGETSDPSGGGNGILTALNQAFGVGDYTLVSTADLETPGFLDSYKAVIVSRDGSDFGTSLSAAAASNVSSYVGSGASQGGVAVLTNDAADNFYGATGGDPYDNNLNQLFINAATYAAESGHGYVGEFNGAVMAMDSNSAGFSALGLLQGSADAVHSYGPQFTYGVGPVGSGNAIDAGVTFPFTDSDDTTFLTDITGAKSSNIVDVYTSAGINGEPAVLANNYVISGGAGAAPEPSVWVLLLAGLGGAGLLLRRKRATDSGLGDAFAA